MAFELRNWQLVGVYCTMIVPCSDATSGMVVVVEAASPHGRQVARQLGLPGRDKADIVDPRTIAVSRMRIRVHLVLRASRC